MPTLIHVSGCTRLELLPFDWKAKVAGSQIIQANAGGKKLLECYATKQATSVPNLKCKIVAGLKIEKSCSDENFGA